ncbi:hypothetical protein PIB30_081389 [Stylosanthes scabra]|uniref:Uncharacterized protein n=1 Tax=Stylosanthes scabra TaxID=79078 RepID=A0ABU6VQ51_9FABA|nr:hypothetical protein [Stylosanthes scabra]
MNVIIENGASTLGEGVVTGASDGGHVPGGVAVPRRAGKDPENKAPNGVYRPNLDLVAPNSPVSEEWSGTPYEPPNTDRSHDWSIGLPKVAFASSSRQRRSAPLAEFNMDDTISLPPHANLMADGSQRPPKHPRVSTTLSGAAIFAGMLNLTPLQSRVRFPHHTRPLSFRRPPPLEAVAGHAAAIPVLVPEEFPMAFRPMPEMRLN